MSLIVATDRAASSPTKPAISSRGFPLYGDAEADLIIRFLAHHQAVYKLDLDKHRETWRDQPDFAYAKERAAYLRHAIGCIENLARHVYYGQRHLLDPNNEAEAILLWHRVQQSETYNGPEQSPNSVSCTTGTSTGQTHGNTSESTPAASSGTAAVEPLPPPLNGAKRRSNSPPSVKRVRKRGK